MISRQAPHLIHIPSGVLTRFSPSSFLRNSRIAIASSPHRLFQGSHEPSEGPGPLTRGPVTLHHPDAGAPHDRSVGMGGGLLRHGGMGGPESDRDRQGGGWPPPPPPPRGPGAGPSLRP